MERERGSDCGERGGREMQRASEGEEVGREGEIREKQDRTEIRGEMKE